MRLCLSRRRYDALTRAACGRAPHPPAHKPSHATHAQRPLTNSAARHPQHHHHTPHIHLRTATAASRAPRRLLCSASSPKPDKAPSTVARIAASPVTWLSATATLAALYGLYHIQYQRQLHRHRVAGRPDLGGAFALRDVDGKLVTSADLTSKWTLLYFGFTKCPDICPQEMEKISNVLTRLDGRGMEIQPVFITIDPARDDAARLRSYFKNEDFHPRFLPLTGTFDSVRKACRAYRVYFTKPTKEEIARGDYLIDHSIISYLLDPDGHFVEYFGKSLSADEMEAKMHATIAEWERERWLRSTLPVVATAIYGAPAEPSARRVDSLKEELGKAAEGAD